jgi:hypothetical protein
MKQLLALAVTAMIATAAMSADTKTVCKDVKRKDGTPLVDKKTGKTVRECKQVRVHKKVDGTPVPTKPAKK